jgi:uncharacterized protein YprB with RNaseH-like and TPR domain
VRSLTITLEEKGLEDTFRKIALLGRHLGDHPEKGKDFAPDLLSLGEKGLDKAVFLDLETTGFSSTPLFLAGTLVVREENLEIRQFFAKDYSQEKSVLFLLSEFLRGFDTLVTFNGKSYDIPFLKDRLCYHGLPPVSVPDHLDLLHPARRRWSEVFPNCRLVTLEWHLCGRRRVGDVPGSEVPAVYHEFVRRGHSPHMKGVFHHNVMDLVTLVELLCETTLLPSQ